MTTFRNQFFPSKVGSRNEAQVISFARQELLTQWTILLTNSKASPLPQMHWIKLFTFFSFWQYHPCEHYFFFLSGLKYSYNMENLYALPKYRICMAPLLLLPVFLLGFFSSSTTMWALTQKGVCYLLFLQLLVKLNNSQSLLSPPSYCLPTRPDFLSNHPNYWKEKRKRGKEARTKGWGGAP